MRRGSKDKKADRAQDMKQWVQDSTTGLLNNTYSIVETCSHYKNQIT